MDSLTAAANLAPPDLVVIEGQREDRTGPLFTSGRVCSRTVGADGLLPHLEKKGDLKKHGDGKKGERSGKSVNPRGERFFTPHGENAEPFEA